MRTSEGSQLWPLSSFRGWGWAGTSFGSKGRVWIERGLLERSEIGRDLPHIPELIRASISVEHGSRVDTINSQQSLEGGDHLLNSFLEIGLGKFKKLG